MDSLLIMIKTYLLLFICFCSCGKSIKDDVNESSRQLEMMDGTYTAVLAPVNRRISTTVLGEARVFKYGDDFKVASKLRNAPQKKLVQYLHTGSYCPGLEEDQNGDGYLDRYEFMQKAGPAILPLDGDLSSQHQGGMFTLSGNFNYQRSTSYYLMLFDLHLPDELLNDHVVKLKDEHLHVHRKVVAVYLHRASELPVESSREVPIACGVLDLETSDFPDNDRWESDENTDDEIRTPRRPRSPGPRPGPRPRPPNPEDEQYERSPPSSSWWGRVRQRWRRWRNRGLDLM